MGKGVCVWVVVSSVCYTYQHVKYALLVRLAGAPGRELNDVAEQDCGVVTAS